MRLAVKGTTSIILYHCLVKWGLHSVCRVLDSDIMTHDLPSYMMFVAMRKFQSAVVV